MHSFLLNLFRRILGSVRRTSLYPPRWTSLPGARKAEVIKLSDVRPRRGEDDAASAARHELKKLK